MPKMPTREEVLTYAEFMINHFINKFAADIPHEHRDEMKQEAFERILKAYERIDTAKGWKSFVYQNVRGAILDYKKFGQGFHEQRWSVAKEKDKKKRIPGKIFERVMVPHDSDEEIDFDFYVGQHGVFHEISRPEIVINWDLVARMSSCDEVIHAYAKHLRGFNTHEIAKALGIPKKSVPQLITSFIARFDDPEWSYEPWLLQTAYAFGLCGHLGIDRVDQSEEVGYLVGWNLDPVNLDSEDPPPKKAEPQLQLFEAG